MFPGCSEVKSAVDQFRQKGKDKERERNKKIRQEEFNRALLAKDPDVVKPLPRIKFMSMVLFRSVSVHVVCMTLQGVSAVCMFLSAFQERFTSFSLGCVQSCIVF